MSSTFWISDKDLDTEQAKAIEDMPEQESFLIKGPAGSGKTNILLLRAKWFLFKKLSELRIIVFTSSLKNYIRIGCEQYRIPPENTVTCVNFFSNLLKEYGVEIPISDNFEANRAMLAGKAQSLVEERDIRELYDALLVDECQDYMDTELLVLRRLTKRLILVADSRQSIYQITHTPELLEELVDNNIVTLKHHYRSGLKLCRVADAILRDSVNFMPVHGECCYDEAARPSSITLEDCKDFGSQINMIIEKIPDQLDLYPGELIGVLFPKKEQKIAFMEALSTSTIANSDHIIVDTMHGAKGLEFRTVHIGGCEALYRMGPIQKRLAYTAILRGKTAAAIYYSGKVPGYLESAIGQFEAPAPNARVKELF